MYGIIHRLAVVIQNIVLSETDNLGEVSGLYLQQVLDMIGSGRFSPGEPALFSPIIRSLLDHGDYYLVLADYRNYIRAQEEVGKVFGNQQDWARRSILNTAKMGKFSSDRAVLEYARDIWNVEPLAI